MSDEPIAGRQHLADWSHPIVVDRLRDLYAAKLGEQHNALRVLALSHGRYWRFLILADEDKLPGARKDVVGIARLAGLRANVVDDIDRALLDELMDVIVARFLRTPDVARANSKIILAAASRIAAFALAAA